MNDAASWLKTDPRFTTAVFFAPLWNNLYREVRLILPSAPVANGFIVLSQPPSARSANFFTRPLRMTAWIGYKRYQYSSPVSPRGAKKAVWDRRDVAASIGPTRNSSQARPGTFISACRRSKRSGSRFPPSTSPLRHPPAPPAGCAVHASARGRPAGAPQRAPGEGPAGAAPHGFCHFIHPEFQNLHCVCSPSVV